ncbi:hypothetical protein HKX48_005889 [Thoreauomyces humboldtii]|nr:hypothetical protein HKX48_005889 [Thoreauomyces humboldtii]
MNKGNPLHQEHGKGIYAEDPPAPQSQVKEDINEDVDYEQEFPSISEEEAGLLEAYALSFVPTLSPSRSLELPFFVTDLAVKPRARQLRVSASFLPACVGLHRFHDVDDAALELFAATWPQRYRLALKRNNLEEQPDIAATLLQIPGATAKVLEAVQSAPSELSANLKKVIRDVAPHLSREITGVVFKERGTNSETACLDRLEVALGQKILQRNEQKYRECIDFGGPDPLVLSGMVDGIAEDGTLIEVKSRQRKVFSDVPLYEKIQVHAYMHLTKKSQCIVAQNYSGTERIHTVAFDPVFWEAILDRLRAFARRVEDLCHDEGMQDMLLIHQHFLVAFPSPTSQFS